MHLSISTLVGCGGGGASPGNVTGGSKGALGVTFAGTTTARGAIYDTHRVNGGCVAGGGLQVNTNRQVPLSAIILWGDLLDDSAGMDYYKTDEVIDVKFLSISVSGPSVIPQPLLQVTCGLNTATSSMPLCSKVNVTLDKNMGKLIFASAPLTTSPAQSGITATGTLTFPTSPKF